MRIHFMDGGVAQKNERLELMKLPRSMINILLNQENVPIHSNRTWMGSINIILTWDRLNSKAKYELVHYMSSVLNLF